MAAHINSLLSRLEADYKKELHDKLKEQAEQSARELDEALSRELSECDALRLQKSEIELRLRLLREELTLQSEQEKLLLTETWQTERRQLEEEHAARLCNIDNMLSLVGLVLGRTFMCVYVYIYICVCTHTLYIIINENMLMKYINMKIC